ncbi:hypothetical protein CONLIGDRAFT_679705 [Coniochaeta ligniaria NRRL 30616]|uniref:Uncharacterized protein n=1 Tax=Coniochaeta ligniaria NRRL 30616 TaxID=1408157 RepID=A0A1J7JT71_9PEZI|nr:hypothetical protein CONLIGDRAFT_679705 [Coniochaeta ligniaria NRRL 30616]
MATPDYGVEAVRTAINIFSNDESGDILIFAPGEEVRRICELIRASPEKLDNSGEDSPFYSSGSESDSNDSNVEPESSQRREQSNQVVARTPPAQGLAAMGQAVGEIFRTAEAATATSDDVGAQRDRLRDRLHALEVLLAVPPSLPAPGTPPAAAPASVPAASPIMGWSPRLDLMSPLELEEVREYGMQESPTVGRSSPQLPMSPLELEEEEFLNFCDARVPWQNQI